MDAQGLPVGDKPKPEPDYGFVVANQKVELEIDFSTQSLTGRCEISILPQTSNLTEIRLDARQCVIPPNGVSVNGSQAEFIYEDPMRAMDIHKDVLWGVHQADMQKERLKPMTEDTRSKGPLVITFPQSVRLEKVDPLSERAATPVILRAAGVPPTRAASILGDVPLSLASATPKTAVDLSATFQPLTIVINFSVKSFRDGLHFVGLTEGDARFPHVYTKHAIDRGTASCIFPCVDDSNMRCTWNLAIKCSRTLGDALRRHPVPVPRGQKHHSLKKGLINGLTIGIAEDYEVPLSDDEKLLEMTVVGPGEQTNETIDHVDSSKKIVSFQCETPIAPQHIGFAIGPFEQVDLSEFREVEDDAKLGQAQVIPIWAYCLPGRTAEVRHTCVPLTHALDYFHLAYGTFPFPEYRLVFVDDQILDTQHVASISLCSTRLLFAEGIIDPEVENVRTLVHAIVSQWIGVSIVPGQPCDRWVTIGLSHFLTGLFMKHLCGNNEYAFRQKTLSDKLVELDFQRPSIYALGEVLSLGSFEYDFMKLKAPLVMFILDRRLVKFSGVQGLVRVIARLILLANTSGDTVVTTESFRKLCEKITKYRQTETFWTQWVLGSGCPRLSIQQKFNKKRLCVEMTITQKQDTVPTQRELEKGLFLREVKEEVSKVWAGDVQTVFTGPLTIRIHEADGTPYEHIVEIREGTAKIEIPYNTKYKRLKRSRNKKERQNAPANVDPNAEGAEDTLWYCLGDTLQGEEMGDWGIIDWDPENEAKMELESYEWIRVDADFEWLCEKQFPNMPAYMYVSQLQQDRDVVAQQESMLYLKNMQAHVLVATFLTRTLVDTRYFHGIRTMAAESLKTHASAASNWVGMKQLEKAYSEFYCYPGTKTPRPNDFSDKRAYKVEMAIIKSMAQIRDTKGNCPKQSRIYLLDMLRFNENSSNQFSDNFKIATLLSALTESLIPLKDVNNVLDMDDDEEDVEPQEFQKSVLEELDRYRRMDEWINSFQNIFTVTVLDCKQRLMKAKVIPLDAVEFVQYLHDGTSDYVRIKAFRSLIDLGYLTNDSVASLLLNVASTDPSPYTRRHLFEVFCLGVAAIAFGENKKPIPSKPKLNGVAAVNEEQDVLMGEAEPIGGGAEGEADGGLIVDQDATADAEARALLIARTKTIDGALLALKAELKDNEVLKAAIWKAVKSPSIGLAEQLDLLDICHVMYETVWSMIIKMHYPRAWKVKHLGKGELIFSKTDKIRTKPLRPAPVNTVVVEPPKTVSLPPNPTPQPAQVRPTMIKFKSSLATPTTTVPIHTAKPVVPNVSAIETMKPPSKPAPKRPVPEHVPSSDDRPRKRAKVVKLRLTPEGISKALDIQSFPPNPAPVRSKSSTNSSSPAPSRYSPAPNRPSPRPSPAPKSSPNPRTALPQGPAAPRHALPPGPARTALPPGPAAPRHALPQGPAAPRTALPPSPAPSSNPSASPAPASSHQTSAPTGAATLKIRRPLPDAVPRGSIDVAPAQPAPKKSLILKLSYKKSQLS